MLDFEFVWGTLDLHLCALAVLGLNVCLHIVDGCSIAELNPYPLARRVHIWYLSGCVFPYDLGSVLFDLHLNLAGNLVNISLAYRADLLLIVHWQCLDSCCLFVTHL